MKKNIMYIFGNNSALAEDDKNNLIKVFREKYGKESVEICPLGNGENNENYYNKIASVGLFESTRMFIFSGGKEKKSRSKKWNKTNDSGFEKFLEKILPILSDTDFLLFYNLESGEENLKKWLNKNASPRERNINWNAADWAKKYNISENIAKKILFRYQSAEKMRDRNEPTNPLLGHLISMTMKNISVLENLWNSINDEIIADFSYEYSGGKIFDFIDAIMSKNLEKSFLLKKIFEKNIQTPTEMSLFMGQMIGIFKKNLYILTLKNSGKNASEIIKILPGISPYMVDKCMKSKINKKELWDFFQKIQNTIIAYRSGKWMKENILWQFLEIDTALLELQK